MKTLELSKMETIEGGGRGIGCVHVMVGLGLMMVGATLITGPVGAAIFAASFVNGSIAAANAC